ncbi:PAS domain-containing protein [Oceanobacillus sp. CF4.6]|uniref:PAS domain-containing protein n=1 Tax=Oceanobacillus sp. CF4.6 TaxID=3373080 RepID=UPI003EE56798
MINDDKIFCSDSCFDIFGLDYSDNVNVHKPFEFVHPDDFEMVLHKVDEGKNFKSEYRIFHGKIISRISLLGLLKMIPFKKD